MRKTNLVTISIPPSMASEAEKFAKKKGMTRSELIRSALRRYMEEAHLDEAVKVAEKEFRSGKAKILGRGGLAALMRKK